MALTERGRVVTYTTTHTEQGRLLVGSLQDRGLFVFGLSTPSGDTTQKVLTATIYLTGSVVRSVKRILSATIHISATIIRSTKRSFTAIINIVGSVVKAAPAPILQALQQIGSYIKATWS